MAYSSATYMNTMRISKNINTRVVPSKDGYIGYIYVDDFKDEKNDKDTILLNIDFENGWHKVTGECFTRWGCRREIKNWLNKHRIDEANEKLD